MKKFRFLTLILSAILLVPLFNFAGCGGDDDTGLTKEQEAIIVTAKAYLSRGNRIQYADTRFTSSDYDSFFTTYEYRWESRGENGELKKDPEDYTSTDIGYTNCADFTHDVYYSALNYDIKLDTTLDLIREAQKKDTKLGVYYRQITGFETAEEKARIEKEYRETLTPGDIIVFRNSSNGHAMLYVGLDAGISEGQEIIHSTGSVYNYTNKKENFEQNGTVQERNLDYYFKEGASNKYLFTYYTDIAIIRPLNAFNGEIPEATKNRINNLQGIVVEKLSDPAFGGTVSPNSPLTFTFNVINTNDKEVDIEITDVVPENSTFLSADAEFSVNKNNLSASFKIAPNQTKSISYTVTAGSGDFIYSEAGLVNGVPVKCKKIYVRNTLTSEQQASIAQAIKTFTNSNSSNLSDVNIINNVYMSTTGKNTKLSGTNKEIINQVFSKVTATVYKLNDKSDYFDLVAPAIYGGRLVGTSAKFDRQRTRLVYPRQLIIGDVILTRNDGLYQIYMYTGENLYKVDGTTVTETSLDFLETLNASEIFAVLRPSIDLAN